MHEATYLSKISEKLWGVAKVLVKSGQFAGIEGKVVRLNMSRKVMVEIPGLLAVVSTYIPVKDLEVSG